MKPTQEVLPMNIASSTNTPLAVNQSILKSANEQPKLALQLLQKSLAGNTPQNSQTPSKEIAPITSQASPPRIDIRV